MKDKPSSKNHLRFYEIISDQKTTNLRKYQSLVVGENKLIYFLGFELLTCIFGSLPGAFGLFTRKLFYKYLFGKTGEGCLFGQNITLRNPKNIYLGNKTVIDDLSMLSARGCATNYICLGNELLIGRGAMIRVKNGTITINDYSTIGPFTSIGTTQNISIGKYVTTGPFCQIGLLSKDESDTSIPNAFRGFIQSGGVIIGNNVAIGGNVTILDGVTIGNNCTIGAGSVVVKDIPDNFIAYGVPAKAIKEKIWV